MQNKILRKGLVVGIIVLFIGTFVTPSTAVMLKVDIPSNEKLQSIPNAEGNIFYVDDDFNESTPGWNITHFDTIKAAKNAANHDDTIFVYNGTYIGFTSKKRLNYIGESNKNTKIKVWWSDEKIELKADWTNFTNFMVTGRYIGYEGELLHAIGDYMTISNCNFKSGGSYNGMTVGGEYWYTGDYYSHDTHVINCSFQDSGSGLLLYLSHHCVIENCSFTDNSMGIRIMCMESDLHRESYHHIINCELHDTSRGIYIWENEQNYISNCKIYNNSEYGILIKDSGAGYKVNNNYITSSLIYNNGKGVVIDRGIFYGSDKNCILGNIISNNKYGVVCWEEGNNGNIIHHNNFINNSKNNAEDVEKNFWDNGSVGNYWDDYTGVDNDGDGIGDTPYLIPGGGDRQDNYPLMVEFSMDEQPPIKPIIDALSLGYQWVSYNIYALSIDSNYDSLYYFFDWGDGNNSGWVGPFCHEINGTAIHKWTEPGSYNIKVKVKDITGLESDWSDVSMITIEPNNRPTQPDLLDSPYEGIVGFPVNFSVVSTDNDGEQIKYHFDWADQKQFWTDYNDSGVIVNKSHKWGDWYNKIPKQKTFNVKIKAQDEKGADSIVTTRLMTIKNNPPIAPIILRAPDKINVNQHFTIKVTAADPDDHQIAFEVDWGGPGWLHTNIFIDSWKNYTIDSSYGGHYNSPGNYTIRIRAYDYYGADGNWTIHKLKVVGPPKEPTINGKRLGNIGKLYFYDFNAKDPNKDDVRYIIDWGDNTTVVTDFYPSNIDVTLSHIWKKNGIYSITAQAENTNGLVGPKATFKVIMLRNRVVSNSFLLRFLERYPLLNRLLNLLIK